MVNLWALLDTVAVVEKLLRGTGIVEAEIAVAQTVLLVIRSLMMAEIESAAGIEVVVGIEVEAENKADKH